MTDRIWQGATAIGRVRVRDLTLALRRVARARSERQTSPMSGSLLLVNGEVMSVVAGDGARLAQMSVTVDPILVADPIVAVVPDGFGQAVKERYARADAVDVGLSRTWELLVRREGDTETLVQELWDADPLIDAYNAFSAVQESAGLIVVPGPDLLSRLRSVRMGESIDLVVEPASVTIEGAGADGDPVVLHATSLPPQRITVDAHCLADAIDSVVDVKHPLAYVELLSGDVVRCYAATREDEPSFGSTEHAVRVGASADEQVPDARVPAPARIDEPPVAEPFDDVLAEIDDIVGQDDVKKAVQGLVAQVKINRKREEQGLRVSSGLQHLVFTGPPGTGKTTVARIIAKLYHALGLLENPVPVEVDRGELISSNIGGTDENMKAAIDRAQGGVFFLDEAYALVDGSGHDFGKKAIDVLLKAAEDQREDFVCILAGYTDEMKTFMQSNPGLKSRFPREIRFTPYRPDDLVEIAHSIASSDDNELSDAAAAELARRLADEERRGGFERKDWGNAREIRNLVEAASQHRDMRIALSGEHDRASLVTLAEADIAAACDEKRLGNAGGQVESVDGVLAELDSIVGQPQLKDQVRAINAQVRMRLLKQQKGASGGPSPIEHMLFVGPPGTGKTTVARLIARLYGAHGLLPNDQLVDGSYENLVAGFKGQTAMKTAEKIDEAMGGVLFIDEAYRLADRGKDGSAGFGTEAIDTLVPRLEDDRGKFLAIAAGYPDDMQRFVDSNPGLKSRFTTTIEFTAYTAADLVAIASSMAAQSDEHLTEGALAVLAERLEVAERGGAFAEKDWGNARSVRHVVDRAIQRRDLRIVGAGGEPDDLSALSTIEAVDMETACDVEGIGESGCSPRESADDVLAELDAQIGQAQLKQQVRALIAQAELARERSEVGSSDGAVPLEHLLFVGPPGTGKTTIARLLARLYAALGLLPSGTVVEVGEPDLTGRYVGETAQKTTKVIDEAMGGVLFIDEAYTLAKESHGHNFGEEAINTLLPRLENDRGKFLTIAAGYPDDMDRFVGANPGLESRFTERIEFLPYSVDEHVAIAELIAKKAKQSLDDDARATLRTRLSAAEQLGAFAKKAWGNGREARILIEGAMKQRDLRLHAQELRETDDLMRITAADVAAACDARSIVLADRAIDKAP